MHLANKVLRVDDLGRGSGISVPLPPPSLRYVRQDIPTSYSQSWNLSLQREVLRGSVLALRLPLEELLVKFRRLLGEPLQGEQVFARLVHRRGQVRSRD